MKIYRECLTEREQDIANLVAEGLANRQIAERLFLSEITVKNYITRARQKTGSENRVQLARYVWFNSRPWDGS